jgi:hypothetical protein
MGYYFVGSRHISPGGDTHLSYVMTERRPWHVICSANRQREETAALTMANSADRPPIPGGYARIALGIPTSASRLLPRASARKSVEQETCNER